MTCSRALSAIKAAPDVILGRLVALITQALIFPVLGMQVMIWRNPLLSGVFTLVSLLRCPVLRRIFPWAAH